MKKQLIAIAILSTVLCVGCIPPRQPQKYTYTVVTPPTSTEGRKCATECEKMMIQKKQLANQERMSKMQVGGTVGSSGEVLADLEKTNDYWNIQREYDQCILDCGGKEETKTEMR